MNATYELEQVVEGIQTWVKQLRSKADELEGRAKRIETGDVESGNQDTPPATQAEWAMNDVENLIRNLNFAGMARKIACLKAGG